MSEQKKPAQIPGVVDIPSLSSVSEALLKEDSNDPMAQFFKLMIMREKRELLKAQQEENARLTREAARAKNKSQDSAKILLRQARCKHLKGATSTANNPTVDYAVYQHTFVNTDTIIKCTLCGMKWRPEDTVEYLFRNGRKISNHTKIGWREAVLMTKQSTNKQSSSEIPFSALYEAQRQGKHIVNPDAYGLQADVSITDDKGNKVESVEL